MSIAETAAFGPYYETFTETQKESASKISGLLCGGWCTFAGGIASTYTITLLTSKVWPDATYTIPLITVVAGGALLLSACAATHASRLSTKIVCALPGVLCCIPFSPFLIGAIPGIAITAIAVCPTNGR